MLRSGTSSSTPPIRSDWPRSGARCSTCRWIPRSGTASSSYRPAPKMASRLDLVVDDLDDATAEIETLGGRWLEPGRTRELEGFRWRLMADPEGNEFDIDVLPAGEAPHDV